MHQKFMNRCLELARLGQKHAAPNPMVGSVVVHKGVIIGEGYHRKHGEAHAEVNAIGSVKDKSLLSESTIYVSLEPCSHYGKTPPCADLIIKSGIPNVVIATIDPFAKVMGQGIEKLNAAGCKVEVGILEKEACELNKRFFTFHQQKRPFVLLKWAQSSDGFIDKIRTSKEERPFPISNSATKLYVHETRAIESAILVGKQTALLDNPQLNVRLTSGNHPTRIVIDRKLEIPKGYHLLDQSIPTIVFNAKAQQEVNNIQYEKIDFDQSVPHQILDRLYELKIQSVMIEGGTKTLQSFINTGLWDEAHVITATKKLNNGVSAPTIKGASKEEFLLEGDQIQILTNDLSTH